MTELKTSGQPVPSKKVGIVQLIKGIIFVFLVTGFIGFLIFDQTVKVPKAQNIAQDLAKEFNLIVPLPDANSNKPHVTVKGVLADVGVCSTTTLSYIQIKDHYSKELVKNGWKFLDDKSIKDWGRDFGGREVTYCKGVYRADIQYAGDHADYGWTYAFDLTWNEDNQECQ